MFILREPIWGKMERQTLPKICPKYAQNLSKINKFFLSQLGENGTPNSAKNQQGLDSTWGKIERQTLPKYAQTLPKIIKFLIQVGGKWNAKLWPKSTTFLSQLGVKSKAKICPKICPKLCPISAQMCLNSADCFG